MNIIEERIKDTRFLDLIRKALNAGYMEATTYFHSLIGTPQGSIVSPVLCNIYMDKLDKFMEGLAKEFDRGKAPRHNPVYVNLQYKKRKAKTTSEKRDLHRLMLSTPSQLVADPNYRRLTYIRYADD